MKNCTFASTLTLFLVPASAAVAASCAQQGYVFTLYDFDRECKLLYEGYPPPRASHSRCDRFVDATSTFEDDDGLCWFGTYCPTVGDLPQYHDTERCALVLGVGEWGGWPFCPEGPKYRPTSTRPRR